MVSTSSSSSLLPINGNLLHLSSHSHFLINPSLPLLKRGFGRERDGSSSVISIRTKSQAFRLLANNVSVKRNSPNEAIMVDPLEAKKLAEKQMKEIRAKERFKRRRQIEAINGAWAMIGLTAGMVIEGQTGKTIFEQLGGYLSAIFHFFFGWL